MVTLRNVSQLGSDRDKIVVILIVTLPVYILHCLFFFERRSVTVVIHWQFGHVEHWSYGHGRMAIASTAVLCTRLLVTPMISGLGVVGMASPSLSLLGPGRGKCE